MPELIVAAWRGKLDLDKLREDIRLKWKECDTYTVRMVSTDPDSPKQALWTPQTE